MHSVAFDLPDHLEAKADPALIARDDQHFAAIAESLRQSIAELSDQLDAERKSPGGIPVGGAPGGRSVTTSWDDLPEADLVVVAPCGFGLDAAVEQSAVVGARLPGAPLIAIDSARFVVQPGPALVDGVEALAWALHPDVVPKPPAGRVARV